MVCRQPGFRLAAKYFGKNSVKNSVIYKILVTAFLAILAMEFVLNGLILTYSGVL